MRFAVIDGETVVNVIEAEPGFAIEGMTLVASEVAGPGWSYADGVFVPPPPEPPPVPVAVTRGQAMMALYDVGLLNDVRTVVANHPYEPVRVWFDNALNWERGNAYIAALAIELSLSSEQVDDLFRAAALKA